MITKRQKLSAQDVRSPALKTGSFHSGPPEPTYARKFWKKGGRIALFFCNFSFGRAKEKFFRDKDLENLREQVGNINGYRHEVKPAT